MEDDAQDIEAGLARVRELVETQRPLLSLPARTVDPAEVRQFFAGPPAPRTAAERLRIQQEIERLSPWLQGPFSLGDGLLIEGLWRIDGRWDAIEAHVGDLSGKRVLDIGSNAGYDPFVFHTLGARAILACEPFEFIAQARFLESIYQTGVDFQQIGWQRLDPKVYGRFDFVHCNGVLYHEPNPMGMLQRLRSMLTDDGVLLLGSMMLEDPSLSEHVRFVRHDYAGDPTWWWVPGRLALRQMMDAVGLETESVPVEFLGPNGDFRVINGYLRGTVKDPDEELAVTRSTAPS